MVAGGENGISATTSLARNGFVFDWTFHRPAEQHFANIRMALAAHLEGVMNGTFLLAVGAIWSEVRLSSRASAVAYWTCSAGHTQLGP